MKKEFFGFYIKKMLSAAKTNKKGKRIATLPRQKAKFTIYLLTTTFAEYQ